MRVKLVFAVVFSAIFFVARAQRDPIRAKRAAFGNRQLLVGYWGQNANGRHLPRANWEKDLRHFCNNYDFDIYVIAFVHRLFDARNRGPENPSLPGMNFANHCDFVPDPTYGGIFECATIGGGIRDCQKLGKKVLISLGGDTCDGTLGSARNARALARNIWDMFLGGDGLPNKRPFLWSVLDGVDLDIEVGSHKYYPDFVHELRRLMRTDTSKQYLITAAPQCPFPDRWMGPNIQGSALQDFGHEFDYLFIQFYNNYCYPGDKYFVPVMATWLKWANSISNGPLILLGLPAGKKAAGKDHYYFPPNQLAEKYKLIRDKPGVGGLMFWDCSFVQNNIINGKHYSEYAFQLVSGGTVNPPTNAPVTTAPPPPPTTKPPVVTTAKTTTKAPVTTHAPSGSLDCTKVPNGMYPHSSDCTKFITCHGGVKYEQACAPGLYYNKKTKSCDWPRNVTC